MTKCALTDIASVVKTVQHFMNSKWPHIIPEKQRFKSKQVKMLYNHIVCYCIIFWQILELGRDYREKRVLF